MDFDLRSAVHLIHHLLCNNSFDLGSYNLICSVPVTYSKTKTKVAGTYAFFTPKT